LTQLDHFAETSQFALQLGKVVEWENLCDSHSGQIGLRALSHKGAQGVELKCFESLWIHWCEVILSPRVSTTRVREVDDPTGAQPSRLQLRVNRLMQARTLALQSILDPFMGITTIVIRVTASVFARP
jgi:hypothetical protein